MATKKSRFAAIATAEVYESGKFFELGEHEVEIEKVILKNTRKSGEQMIFETRVLASKNPDGTECAALGQKRTIMVSMQKTDTAFNNLLEIVAALFGVDKGDKEKIHAIRENAADILDDAVDEDTDNENAQVLKGYRAHVSCVPYTTKPAPGAPNGKEITLCRWSPVSAEFGPSDPSERKAA